MTPDVEPGYLRELLPNEAPKSKEKWEDIMKDVESKILPGVSTIKIESITYVNLALKKHNLKTLVL